MSERLVDLGATADSRRKPQRGLYLDPHQTRNAEPTAAENAIGDVIERCYAAGMSTPEPIVEALNKAGVEAAAGGAWTVASFQSEMKRLGA